MSARRDVHEVFLAIRLEGIAAGEISQRAIDLLEIPRIIELDDVPTRLRLG